MNINNELTNAFIFYVFGILMVFIILIIVSLGINIVRIVLYKCESFSKSRDDSEMKKSLEID